MATIKDIAEKAGVSVATVSYCINNTKSIKPETRMKIMQAIEELNYIPNTHARQLKNDVSTEIGVVFPGIEDYCHSELLKGIVSSAENRDYSVNIAFSYNTSKLERKIINQFISKNVAGLIILTCQPQNTEYFQNSLIKHQIPNVFIDQFPAKIDASCLAFDNYRTCYYLATKLIEKGYSKISLMTGYFNFFSENLCSEGLIDAYDDAGLEYLPEYFIQTNMSKESAFKEAMFKLVENPPEAIITSSEILAKGILEAFNLCNVKVPETTCLITLGEECWNASNYLPNIIHTSRTAYTLGKTSVEVLLDNIKTPELFEKKFMLFKDNILDSQIDIPAFSRTIVPKKKAKETLRILATPLPPILSLQAISREFSNLYDVEIIFEMVTYRELTNTIVSDSKQEKCSYDIYLFDVSWLTYLANEDALLDITDLIRLHHLQTNKFVKKNYANAQYKNKQFGIPIIGGAQILFYRKDLFETPSLQKQFCSQHNLSLRPPRTWTEFNGIAKFFTRENNPDSPTQFGTTIQGGLPEELVLEIMIRLWSFGGGLYDASGKLNLDTPQNVKGFQSLLETSNYVEREAHETISNQAFSDFGNGKIAMLISYVAYASQIHSYLHSEIIAKIGYSFLPGNTPANVGWHLGVSKTSEKQSLIAKYFNWIVEKRTSYYSTILDGQSTVTYPHQNHEILKIYPWLEISEAGMENSRSRVYPYKAHKRLVPPYEVEAILCEIYHNIKNNNVPISQALKDGQAEIQRLFATT